MGGRTACIGIRRLFYSPTALIIPIPILPKGFRIYSADNLALHTPPQLAYSEESKDTVLDEA
jgi:hypothetical protein